MNSIQFRKEIEIKRPKYLVKYKPLMEAISEKGKVGGGDYIKFGPFFQTYMYAFMIGFKRKEFLPLSETGEKLILLTSHTGNQSKWLTIY